MNLPQFHAAYPNPLDLFLVNPGMPEMWHNLNGRQGPEYELEEQIKVYLLSTSSKVQFTLW